MKTPIDVKVMNCGSVWQFFALTKAAKTWIREKVEVPDHMRIGNAGFNCEHRYGTEIVKGMRQDNLLVTGF